MIWSIVYIVGVILCFVILLRSVKHVKDVTIGDILSTLTVSLASWCTVLWILLVIIPWDKVKEKYCDKVIIKKRK